MRINLRRSVVIIGVIFANLLILSLVWGQGGDEEIHWEYEGEAGPEHWGELDPTYALCSEGRAQSPINIEGAGGLDLKDIQFNYQPSALNIFNNGHTIQVNYDAGSSITYNETTYDLVQFHFHHPSEHSIGGQVADMEIHFVHRDATGDLAVVGVLLMAGEEGASEAYTPIFADLPAEEGEPAATEVVIIAADLLPAEATYYTYSGSLTTPPCSQDVRWLVMTEPVVITEAQLAAFGEIFELNARPVQPLNERDLLEDTN